MRIYILTINILLTIHTTHMQAWPPGSGGGYSTYVAGGGGSSGGYDPNTMTPYMANYRCSAIKEFFFIKNMVEQEKINQDIANIILSRIIPLKLKTFETKFPPKALKEWNNFSIPLAYACMLTSKQLCALEYVLLNGKPVVKDPNFICYKLPNKKTYQWFLTLPILLREHLLELPQSQQNNSNTENNMHLYQTIFIFSRNKSKFIIPEEHKKKKKKKKKYIKFLGL